MTDEKLKRILEVAHYISREIPDINKYILSKLVFLCDLDSIFTPVCKAITTDLDLWGKSEDDFILHQCDILNVLDVPHKHRNLIREYISIDSEDKVNCSGNIDYEYLSIEDMKNIDYIISNYIAYLEMKE